MTRLLYRALDQGTSLATIPPSRRSSDGATVQPCCTFVTQSRDPFIRYVLDLFTDFADIRFETVEKGSGHVDVYYGNDRSVNCSFRIPQVASYSLDSIPRPPSEADLTSAAYGNVFPFDFFKAIHFWLTDEANTDVLPSGIDVHDRLLAAASAQERLGIREIPIVNAYMLWLRCLLEQRFQFTRSRRKCAIVLSHDVENPIDPSDWRHDIWLAGVGTLHLKPREAASQLRKAWRRESSQDRYSQFEEIVRSEERYGFRSTFFFSAISKMEGHELDNSYDVRSPRFRALLPRLVNQGWEVGVHFSYNARESVSNFVAERKRIERIAQCKVLGTRHHYWHLRRPMWQTWEDHARSGLTYDTSAAFNEQPGYRLGIAFLFHPWNPDLQRRIDCVQIPTFMMDGAFFYDPKMTIDTFVQRFMRLLEQLKRFEGIACIDWHDYCSYPGSKQFRLWGEAYLELLKILASDRDVAVCSCAEILKAV